MTQHPKFQYIKLIQCLYLAVCAAVLLLAGPSSVHAEDHGPQRKQFLAAREAIRQGDAALFSQLAGGLKDYPLYPYLRYYYLRARMAQTPPNEIREFLDSYTDTPLNDRLRTAWLGYLGKTGQWQTYLDNYTPQNDILLRCYHLQARLNTNKMEWLLQDAKELWLVRNSQPAECDPVFQLLSRSPLMTPDLVWRRIRLAMDAGDTKLARFLSKRLDSSGQQWVGLWLAVHDNPATGLRRAELSKDGPNAREIIVHGITRLAASDPDQAFALWSELKGKYAFPDALLAEVARTIALEGVERNLPQASGWLDLVPASGVDVRVQQTRLSTAIAARDWSMLKRWTTEEAAQDMNGPRWRYWRARALESSGDKQNANEIYQALAEERDYYGFAAADRLGLDYRMQHQPTQFTPQEEAAFLARPGIIRAQELRAVGLGYEARSEWAYAIAGLDERQVQLAAHIAHRWGWYDRAIIALRDIKALNDLEVRFPMPHQNLVLSQAKARQLDPAMVFGFIRAESAFLEDARSPSGALGLMQLMPATGADTASRIGITLESSTELLNADKNVLLGTTYLRQMLDRFQGNVALSAAAYNAGPNRVDTWRPAKECQPADLWIELIPLAETHQYVRNILFYSIVYEWRMTNKIRPLAKWLMDIPPKSADKMAFNCLSEKSLTQN